MIAIPAAAAESYLRPLGGSLPASTVPVITGVTPDSPAARAGLVVGDTLWSIDRWPVQTLDDVKHIMLRRTGTLPARVAVGTRSGRRDVQVMPRGKPPKLGVSVPAVQIVESGVQIHDVGTSVQGFVLEWAEVTLVQIRARNTGSIGFGLGPGSVTVADARGAIQKQLSADQVIARVYGEPNDEETAADRRVREAARDSLRIYALKSGTVAPGGERQGNVYIGRARIAQPISVRVDLTGRVYTMRFGRPPR